MARRVMRQPLTGGKLGITVKRVGDWSMANYIMRNMNRPGVVLTTLKLAAAREAELARAELIKGIVSGAPGGKKFKAMSIYTFITRGFKGLRGAGSAKPLVGSGSLVRAITTKHESWGSFAGILRTARSADGKALVNVMMIHEKGATVVIPVSPEMQAYLMMMFKAFASHMPTGLGKGGFKRGFIIVKIPKRAVFEPVWKKHFKPNQVAKRVLPLLNAAILVGGGKFGYTPQAKYQGK